MRRLVGLGLGVVLAACTVSEEEVAPVAEPLQPLAVDRDPSPGVIEVTLRATPGEVVLDGVMTPIWGYADGPAPPTLPGPMIVADPGDLLVVHFDNALDDGTTVHFHGPRLPNEMDGAPVGGTLVAPGESFDYVFPLLDAGTFWYHPHWNTAEQVERGLYGQLVVREPAVPAARERFFLLDDVDRDEAGAIVVAPGADDLAHGRTGDTILVNGRITPTLDVPANGLERWHLTNASNGRYFALRLPGHLFTVIGTDGGLLAEPYDVARLELTPGSRVDVVVAIDGATGQALTLTTEPIDDQAPDPTTREVMTLRLGQPGPALSDGWRDDLPRRELSPLDMSGAAERTIRLGAAAGPASLDEPSFFINDESWPFAEPEQGRVGDTEIWTVINDSDHREPFHLHGTFVQPLSLDGIAAERVMLEDVVDVPAGSVLRLAVPFERPGNWMFHSHILEHAELGMMRVLRLVED
ncbi:MAG TPA: multicopper oxidase family protein [Polyangiaceae bacterium]|nr:multicopper oxidase family protein [Polyangiaceae bacterium]